MGKKDKESAPSGEPEKTEIFSEMDAYQEKLTSDWEAAKNSYQAKINDIMSDFIKEKGLDKENLSVLLPEETEKKSPGKIEHLLARAEKLLRPREKKTAIPLWQSSHGSDFVYESQSRLRRMVRLPSFWLALLAVVGLSSYIFLRTPAPVSLPYSHTAGLVVTPQKIYVVDWLRKALFVHRNSLGFPLISVENMPNDFLAGLAITKSKVVSLNSFSMQVVEHDTSPEHLVTDHHVAPGTQASAMYYDGNDLWMADDGGKKLFQFHGLDAGETKEEFHFAGIAVTGLVVEEGRVWILSKKSRTLTLFRLEDPLRQLAVYDLDPILKGAAPTAIDIKGKTLWLTTETPATLRRVPLRSLKSAQN